MTKHTSRTGAAPTPAGPAKASTLQKQAQAGTELLALRAQLSRAEKAARRAPLPVPKSPISSAPGKPVPLKPQRVADLEGVSTDDFSLGRAHHQLRSAVYDSRFHVCSHATQHARAEGFLEHDILEVLLSGRVRAVYPEDHRWLVCGYFEAQQVKLPLHVVVQHYRDGHVDIVTAFVPKQPHHIISRARLAVMLRYDDERVRSRTAQAGNKVGHRGKGRWKKSA